MAETITNQKLLWCGHFKRQADGQLVWKGNDHVLTEDRFQVGFAWRDTRRGKVVEVLKGHDARKLDAPPRPSQWPQCAPDSH